MKAGLILLMMLAIVVPNSALANDATTNTGNELINDCNEANDAASNYLWGFCTGYVLGVANGEDWGFLAAVLHYDKQSDYDAAEKVEAQNLYFCIPENATRQQMALVVSKYLKDHPAELNKSSRQLVELAFVDAWPCEK